MVAVRAARPDVRGLTTAPLGKLTVDGIAGLRKDQGAVGSRPGKEEAQRDAT